MPPLAPAVHDVVLWKGVRWVVMREGIGGRLELALMGDFTTRGLCLASQLHWQPKDSAWLLAGGL